MSVNIQDFRVASGYYFFNSSRHKFFEIEILNGHFEIIYKRNNFTICTLKILVQTECSNSRLWQPCYQTNLYVQTMVKLVQCRTRRWPLRLLASKLGETDKSRNINIANNVKITKCFKALYSGFWYHKRIGEKYKK